MALRGKFAPLLIFLIRINLRGELPAHLFFNQNIAFRKVIFSAEEPKSPYKLGERFLVLLYHTGNTLCTKNVDFHIYILSLHVCQISLSMSFFPCLKF